MDGVFQQPDSDIKKIENEFIQKSSAVTLANSKIDTTFPIRPGHGTSGAHITIFANYFQLNVAKEFNLIRYNVDVKELVKKDDGFVLSSKALALSKKKRKRLFEILLDDPVYSSAMSDFSSFLISRERLGDIGDGSVTVRIAFKKEGEDQAAPGAPQFDMKIQYSSYLPISIMLDYLRATNSQVDAPMREETLQALNVVVNQYAQMNPAITTTGQNKFFALNGLPEHLAKLGGGFQALRGVFKSVRPATARLLLNVNVSHAVCYQEGSLLDLVKLLPTSNAFARGRLLKFVQVKRKHLPSRRNAAGREIPATKTIWDLASSRDGVGTPHPPQVSGYGAGPKDVKFWLETVDEKTTSSTGKKGKKGPKPTGQSVGGQYISVFQFFQNNYPKHRLDASLPVVNVGNNANPTYLPMEVCEVLPGQAVRCKLDPQQTQAMIKFACRTPKENARFIANNARSMLGCDSPHNAALMRYGVSVGKDLITVPARVLLPPSLMYHKALSGNVKPLGRPSAKATARDGSWNMNNISFCRGAKISSYAWIYLRRQTTQAPSVADQEAMEECEETINRFVKFIRTQVCVVCTSKVLHQLTLSGC